MKKIVFIITVLGLIPFLNTSAQEFDENNITVLEQIIVGNDTLPVVNMKPIFIYSKSFATPLERALFMRFRNKVIKVYPYAQIASLIYEDMNDKKESAEKKREVKKYRKDMEKELRTEFEEELKHLTVTEGKILVQLINRQTNNNCYDLIKDVKSGFAAFVWQRVAKKYGYDLREAYDAAKNDDLEYVIAEIESDPERFYANDKNITMLNRLSNNQ